MTYMYYSPKFVEHLLFSWLLLSLIVVALTMNLHQTPLLFLQEQQIEKSRLLYRYMHVYLEYNKSSVALNCQIKKIVIIQTESGTDKHISWRSVNQTIWNKLSERSNHDGVYLTRKKHDKH